jgi:mono/diheme cytochrome c family protein
MKRLVRWIGIGMASAAGLAIVAYAVVYLLSERALRRTYQVPAVTISVPTDSASIVEGRRLATIRGCFGGCHGPQAEGGIMLDDPMLARLVAPNLTAAVRKYSDAELAVAIRNGVRPGGRSLAVMPSEGFVGLTDGDLGRIIAFLKSLPAVPGQEASLTLGPIGRIGFALGQFKLAAQLIAETAPPPEATNEEAAWGRYLARTTCPQCHAADLRGTSNPGFTSPDLQVVAGYTPEAFTQLLRTGVAPGGRNLAMMGPWARDHLSHFTDAEIAALYRYLHSLPQAVAH